MSRRQRQLCNKCHVPSFRRQITITWEHTNGVTMLDLFLCSRCFAAVLDEYLRIGTATVYQQPRLLLFDS